MPELRFRNQHARHKRAKRHRQTELLGQPGQAERHEEHIKHEEFGGLALRHEKEPFAQKSLAKYKHQSKQGQGFEQGNPHGHRHLLGRLRERGNKNKQRDDRQILKQQHAHHFATVRRIKLPAFAEHLGQKCRGGHGQRAAERQSRLPGHTEHKHDTGYDKQRRQHLQQAEAKHNPPHGHQARQRKLQPDGEHQENDTELGQIMRPGKTFAQSKRMRPNHRTDQQITENRRQIDASEQDNRQHRSAQQHQNNR